LRVADVEAALAAIEERRRDCEIPVGRVAVRDAADMAVDAEDLLDDDERAAGLAGGLGAIGGKAMAVRCSEFDGGSLGRSAKSAPSAPARGVYEGWGEAPRL